MLRDSKIYPVKEISFLDHQKYQENMLTILTSKEEQLLMTEKDAIKCKKFAKNNWWYIPIYVCINKKFKKVLLKPIENKIKKYRKKFKKISY
ncbi:tetraacyldisaccharide 4'-kinase [Wigglesworthia glossinidia]|uniref:tetraacyldisaccharide 4'-kinase n=1 Tax=Wigglesworthia glossinidia TaxID=51229 RepID=UPI00030CD6D1|nr:tetraacyldisaccharide 4'-kinase [Wigglesworthia glossinidia]